MTSLSEKIKSDKKIFKLILGAGNKDVASIKRISSVYVKAGVDIFDVNPSKEVLDAMIDTVKECGYAVEDFAYCVSYTVCDDIHGSKAKIEAEKCTKCGKCMEICPEDAICLSGDVYAVDEKKCIGCQKCQCDAISYSTSAAEKDWKNFKDIVEKYPVAMVELHISTTDTKQIFEKWKTVLENFKGYYSICVSRNSFSDAELKTLLDKMISMTDKERVFIQADGVPMSGCVNSYKATLQAVACTELLSGLGVKLIISGGANEKTAQLAKMCDVDYCGIALGSYARKIIKNSSYSDALKSAKKLVNVVKNG